MTIKYTGERPTAGFTMRGANTDPNRPPEPPRQDRGPQLHRDSKYPAMVQNGLKPDFRKADPYHSPNFLVNPSGYNSPVPDMAIGPFPTGGKGVQFKYGSGGHEFNARTSSVRVMDQNWNQGKRTVYENLGGQVIDPKSGRTSIVKGHFYHDKNPK